MMMIPTDATPVGWAQAELGSLADVQAGLFSSRLRPDLDTSDGCPIIHPRNIAYGRIAADQVSRIPKGDYIQFTRYRLEPGDLVCTRIGPTRVAVIGADCRGWLFSGHVLRIRPDGRIRSDFLAAYMTLPTIRAAIERGMIGSTIPSIAIRELRALPVLMPPLPIQDNIIAMINALDEKARIHAEISRTTSELRETLAELMLSGALSPTRWPASP